MYINYNYHSTFILCLIQNYFFYHLWIQEKKILVKLCKLIPNENLHKQEIYSFMIFKKFTVKKKVILPDLIFAWQER